MNLRSELESLPPRELIEALSIQIYEPPLSNARERLLEISEPLRVLILVLDFDTEVCMQGMLGFLENSTGLYFTETIDAFEKIDARETLEVLRGVEKTLQKHGVTPSRLRADFAGTEEYQITTFRELHGNLGSLPEEVEHHAKRLYLYGREGERVWDLLEGFVKTHRQAILDEIARVAGEAPDRGPT
jgi:hypothetical protein